MSLVDFPLSPHLNANAGLDLCHLHAKSLLPSLVARRLVGPQTLCQLRPKDFKVSRLVPDVLALVWPTGVQLLIFFQHFSYFLLSSPHRCLFLYSFDFYVPGDVALIETLHAD